jgi:molecular chaperone GrpE
VTDEKDPQVRVVDRRWWARGEQASEGEAPEGTKPTYVEELERRVAALTTEIQTYAGEHRRAIEEFEQAKLRIRRDVGREVERGRRTVLVELLDVLDNLDRAISAARDTSGAKDVDGLLRGVELVRNQFLMKLEAFGVVRVPAEGQPFDATRHEAITMTPVADAGQDGRVVAVVKEGYAIGDELLRPASVVVGRFEQ